MAKQKPKKEPKPKSKQIWKQDVYIIGYGKIFAGDVCQPEAIAALKELGIEVSKYAG